MSYAVIRMEKVKKNAVAGMQIHNQRERESNTNPDIDRERTPLNYDVLHDAPINYTDEINKQIEERYTGTRAIRKDAVYLCQFVVTSDKAFFDNLSPKDEKRFFEESAEFLKERYGKENILFAAVHKDEKTPHMHVGMVPITKEGKMSAKAFFGQKHELQSLQTDFHKHVQERGFDLERGEKGSDREHLEAQKYKAQTLEKNIHTLESHLKDVQKVDKHLENITSQNKEKDSIGSKFGFKGKESMVMPKDNYDELYAMASRSFEHEKQMQRERQENEQVKESLEQTKAENQHLRAKNKELNIENNLLRKTLDIMKKHMKDKYKHFSAAIGIAKTKAQEILKVKDKDMPKDFLKDHDEQLGRKVHLQNEQKNHQKEKDKEKDKSIEL